MIYALTMLGGVAIYLYGDLDSCIEARDWLQPASEITLICEPAVDA